MPYSGTLYICFSSSTGLSPYVVCHSRQLRIEKLRLKTGPATPHLHTISRWIQFAVCCVRSLLLASSLLISCPSGTETFHFPEFEVLADHSEELESNSGISGSMVACASPEHIAACRALHLLVSQVIQLMGQRPTYKNLC